MSWAVAAARQLGAVTQSFDYLFIYLFISRFHVLLLLIGVSVPAILILIFYLYIFFILGAKFICDIAKVMTII